MSFSAKVKEELEKKTDTAKHCQIAEIAALAAFAGKVRRKSGGKLQLVLTTENEVVARTYQDLLQKAFGIEPEQLSTDREGRKGSIINIRLDQEEQVERVMQAIKWKNEKGEITPGLVHQILIKKDCCKRAFLRGAFLAAGSISDPKRFYHYEIVCDSLEDAAELCGILDFFQLSAKVIRRKKNYVVYLKEGSNITDALNVMGAYVSQMELYNIMILKGMRNDVNRKVNCETANLNKTVEAAVKQIRDISYIRDTAGLMILSANLQEVAQLRLENPDMNLKDLGEHLDPPVGKSGVNHRLRKISEIAEEMRIRRGDA